MQLSLRSVILGGTALAVVLAAAAPAQAQTTPLYSAGGTLAEKVYRDVMNCYGNHSGGDTTASLNAPPAICNAVTPYRSNVELLYLGIGSGNGKKGFVNHDPSAFTDGPKTPDKPPVASTSDFGPFYGTGTGAGWVPNTTDTGPFYPKVSFVGSDDPLNSGDITTYNANKNGWGAPIQVPGLVTAVAIPFKPASGTWNEHGKKPSGGGNSSLVDLSTNTLCGIFNGDINTWNDPAITADNQGQVLGTGTITVVYRSDGSGTTFLTSNALINQCSNAHSTHPIPASWQTATGNASGVGNNSFFVNVHNSSTASLPSNFIGASGSGGVKSTINSTAGSIGYVSPDFVLPIDGTGPEAANLQTYSTFNAGAIAVYKAPIAKNATAIVSLIKAPSFTANSCPGDGDGICAHDPLNWGIAVPKPTSASAYPIGGFTFIDTYTCYASTGDVNAIAGIGVGNLGYLRWYFGTTTENSSLVKNSLTANGFGLVPGSWLSGAKKLLTTDKKTKISTPGTANTGCAGVVGTGA